MDQQEIDRYLFEEMTGSEREKFEEQFFNNDGLFFEIAERENVLVDGYLRGTLDGDERTRFEHSLATNPARREKLANAAVLRDLIQDQRPTETNTITIAERSGFFGRLFAVPAFQFASVGLIAILTIASAYLLVQNRNLNTLDSELAAARQRETELSSQIESERGTSSDLTEDLIAERERIQQLEAEIARLSNGSSNARPQTNSAAPIVATLVLIPQRVRGGPVLVKRVDVPSGASRLSVVVELPGDTSTDRVSVKLNDETVASEVKVRTRQTGSKTAAFAVPITKVKNDARNDVVVLDGAGIKVEEYAFSLKPKQ